MLVLILVINGGGKTGEKMDIKPIQQLLETEMDRKEFLSYVAVLILAVTGITALTKSLAPPEKQSGPKSHKAGYGGSAYGG